jgi:FkbM family methyltransferase
MQLLSFFSKGIWMRLSVGDRLKLLVPSVFYYPHKTRSEILKQEPELGLLAQFARPGSRAIDVGANRGIYSYGLAKVVGHVEAFEPNPAVAHFARIKLGRKVRVHEFALSNIDGDAPLHIPFGRHSQPNHLVARLRGGDRGITIEVSLRTLDSFDFENVSFIKIDVEGSELDVLKGAQRTISRDRPNLLVELLTGTHDDPLAAIAWVAATFGYHPWIVIGSELCAISRALGERKNEIRTRNVLFTPV